MSVAWRSIDESPLRRPRRPRFPAPLPPPRADFTLKAMETSAIFLGSLLLHAVLGVILVMCFFEIEVEPESTYAVTIWRDAKGKDVLRIGAPEEGPVTKGAEVAPEPPKKDDPPAPAAPDPPKVEEPKPAPEPAPRPPDPKPAPEAAPEPVPAPVAKVPDAVPPAPREEPEGGAPDPAAAAPALGTGATAGLKKAEVAGFAKGADAPGAAESEIEKDPTAAIRRRRSGTLTALREGSQRDIVVVSGQYDHIQDVLDRLEIPYSLLDPEQLPRIDLSHCKVLCINCNGTYAQGLFRMANAAPVQAEIEGLEEKEAALRKRIADAVQATDRKKTFEYGLELLKVTSRLSDLRGQLAGVTGAIAMVENVRKFVEGGGYLFTSDWGISILERAFPGTIKNGGNIGPRTVSMRPKSGVKSPLLEEVFAASGPKNSTVVLKKLMWEIDSGSYAIKVEKSTVDILAEAAELSRNPAIAVSFGPDKGNGRVLHVLSHFDRQATKQGDYALQNMLLNFLTARVKQ